MTGRYEKVAAIRNQIEALCLTGELEDRGVPHAIQSYYDLAYDGLFQASRGWGHVEAPPECKDEILAILGAMREKSAQQDDDEDEQEDGGDPA
jgi:hypothetical protein